ncbi:prostate and testis expressed protein 4 [Peromyscus eremicus]|uniref:prostate and testis expressed protein 4 n=1 Tax=Peromyscus eremicus TaxID=42410 RepID=UPI0027DB22D9|nr:prostate and testis expressed protein 4 [Peromyscus eremicus]
MNPATKISTLLIVTLSLLCSVESLICNVCEISRNSKCAKGQERCLAHRGQSCSTVSHYFRGNHLYSQHLCMPNCREREAQKGEKMTYVMCCYKNLCNTF